MNVAIPGRRASGSVRQLSHAALPPNDRTPRGAPMSDRVTTLGTPSVKTGAAADRERARRDWMIVGGGMVALFAVVATILSLAALAESRGADDVAAIQAPPATSAGATAAAAPSAED